MELKKINDNLFKCINLKKLKFKNVMVPFKLSEYNNNLYLNIEIYLDDTKNDEILNYYKNIENIIYNLQNIDNLDISNLSFKSNIKTKQYKNKYFDLLKIQINKSKNTILTKYNNGDNTIFDIIPQKRYNCEIDINIVWLNKNNYGILLKLLNIHDIKKK